MTALCGGGTSQPVSGYTGTITLDGTSIAAYLALIGEAAAAEVLAPLIAGAVLAVDVFCGSDPPADPGIDHTTVTDALNFTNPSVSFPAIAKLKDWFLHSYWCQVCTCTSGPPPTCGTPSSSGGVTQNPGLPGGTNSACFDASYTVQAVHQSSADTTVDIGASLLPPGTPSVVTNATIGGRFGQTLNMYPIPANISRLDISGNIVSHDPGAVGVGTVGTICVGTSTSAGVCTNIFNVDNGDGSTVAQAFVRGNISVWPSADTFWGAGWTARGTGSTTHVPDQVNLIATSTCPGGGTLGCCPPPPTDPNIESKLEQIYGLLSTIYSLIPARVPNYAGGTAHTGLSGGGTITLDPTTIAIKVEITTLPVAYGIVIGTPDTYIDVGWLTPVNNEGPTGGIRVSRTLQTFALPEATSSLDYSLPPSEVITVTELQAG